MIVPRLQVSVALSSGHVVYMHYTKGGTTPHIRPALKGPPLVFVLYLLSLHCKLHKLGQGSVDRASVIFFFSTLGGWVNKLK